MSAARPTHADDERYQHADRGGRSGCAGHGPGPTRGWADPVEHARMLHDDRRTGDYQSALYEAVRRRAEGESCSTSHRKRDSCDSRGWAGARRVLCGRGQRHRGGRRAGIHRQSQACPRHAISTMSPEHGDGLGPAAGTEQSHLPLLAGRLGLRATHAESCGPRGPAEACVRDLGVLRCSGAIAARWASSVVLDDPFHVTLDVSLECVQARQLRRLEGAAGQQRGSAQVRKQAAPRAVFTFAAARLITEPVEGTR